MASILFVIPYHNLFPPKNGGAVRAFHLLRELSREHEVHAVILQPKAELHGQVDGFEFPESVKVYNPADVFSRRSVFDLLPRKLKTGLQYRWLVRSLRGPASGVVLETHTVVTHILEDRHIDVAILEHLQSMMLAPVIRRASPKTRRVLLTHNVDHIFLRDKRGAEKAFRRTLWYESNLARYVEAFFTCSDHDRAILDQLNGTGCAGFTVPNGVDTDRRPFDARDEKSAIKTLIFCGSLGYAPNRDGLLWFCKDIWPRIKSKDPSVRLAIVGRGKVDGELLALRGVAGVDFVGEVAETDTYYRAAGVAVIPLRIGSGTRHKILEAMSLGNPIVSTTLGAEGINVEHGRDILLADKPDEFAAAVLRLLVCAQLFENVRRGARQLVEQKYDWQVIGKQLNAAISKLVTERNK